MVKLVLRNGLSMAGHSSRSGKATTYCIEVARLKQNSTCCSEETADMEGGDCKIIACEHVATQHKPLVFVASIQKRREDKVVG